MTVKRNTPTLEFEEKDRCPYCGGTGTIIITRKDEDGSIKEFGRECERCKIKRFTKESGIPADFRGEKIPDFDFGRYRDQKKAEQLQSIAVEMVMKYAEEWKPNGYSLYLWSNTTGSGKTYLACCIANELLNEYCERVRFITAPDYLAAVEAAQKREAGTEDRSKKYMEAEILILDDLGAQRKSEWAEEKMFGLINRRMEDKKVTIFTSNMHPSDLGMNNRLVDRIVKMSHTIVQMPEEPIRYNKAVEEQSAFIENVLN